MDTIKVQRVEKSSFANHIYCFRKPFLFLFLGAILKTYEKHEKEANVS